MTRKERRLNVRSCFPFSTWLNPVWIRASMKGNTLWIRAGVTPSMPGAREPLPIALCKDSSISTSEISLSREVL